MRVKAFLLLVFVVLAAAFGAARGAVAPVAGRAVLDRTLLCSFDTSGGVREFKIMASAGYRDGRTWGRLPFAVVSTGGTRSRATFLDDSLAWVTAAKPSETTNLVDPARGWGIQRPAREYGTLALNTRACTPSKATVPLTAKGLRDAAPGPLGAEYDCPAPRRILVRVRTVAASKPPLYRDRYFTKSKAPFRESYVVVRTQAGKQLALAAAFDNGKARLLTAAGCEED